MSTTATTLRAHHASLLISSFSRLDAPWGLGPYLSSLRVFTSYQNNGKVAKMSKYLKKELIYILHLFLVVFLVGLAMMFEDIHVFEHVW